MHIAALVPMRTGSRRVVDKNRRTVGDRPLYHHVIEALLAASTIDEVVIDTNDELILAEAARVFPQVRLLRRPAELAIDGVQLNDVLMNLVPQVEADLYLQTHSTNPLVLAQTFDRAVRTLAEARPEHDSLFGVTPRYKRFWMANGTPLNHNPAQLIRTQDLSPIMEENSCLYLFDRTTLEAGRNRIGKRPLLFQVDPAEAWDIDDELDVAIVEALYRRPRRANPISTPGPYGGCRPA
jgi:CMP-N-acetylneuraminic acid synthetase